MGAFINALREEGTREDLLQQIERLLEERDAAVQRAEKMLKQLEAVATAELRNTSLLLSIPPQSSAAWNIRETIRAAIGEAQSDPVTGQTTPSPGESRLRRSRDEVMEDYFHTLHSLQVAVQQRDNLLASLQGEALMPILAAARGWRWPPSSAHWSEGGTWIDHEAKLRAEATHIRKALTEQIMPPSDPARAAEEK